MAKKLAIIVAEGCPACKLLEEKLQKEIKEKQVEVFDVTKSTFAAELAKELDIYKVPTFVAYQKKDTRIEACVLDEKLKPVRCRTVFPLPSDEEIELEMRRLWKEIKEDLKKQQIESANEGELARSVAISNLLSLLDGTCIKPRPANPYNEFLRECLRAKAEQKEGKLTLKDTQENLIECAGIWRSLPEEEKKKWKKREFILANYC